MDNEHSVNIDQHELIAQRVARIAVGKLLRLGFSKRGLLMLVKNTAAAYKFTEPSGEKCSRPFRKEGGNIHE